MSRRNEAMDAKIYVGGLPEDATSEEVEEAFHRFGRIRKDIRDAEDAVRSLDGNNRICGVKARVELSHGGRRDDKHGRGGDRRNSFGNRRDEDRRFGGGHSRRRYSRSRSRSPPRGRSRSPRGSPATMTVIQALKVVKRTYQHILSQVYLIYCLVYPLPIKFFLSLTCCQ
uniref:RRM domain-containing protein n=1 Tax=Ditylenchus dipsaci TaxID=166011 RepID=A0A915EV47_9BILA